MKRSTVVATQNFLSRMGPQYRAAAFGGGKKLAQLKRRKMRRITRV